MATLTSQNYMEIRQHITSNPTLKATFRAWGLSKQNWYAGFQAAENWFTGGFNTAAPATTFKAAVEAGIGAGCTVAQAATLGKVWMQWRFKE
jgi:hypothetical protein